MSKPKKTKVKKPPDLKAFIIAKLRSASRKWPPIYSVKNKQKHYVTVDTIAGLITIEDTGQTLDLRHYKDCRIKNSGRRVMYECEQCHDYFFDKIWVRASTNRWIKKSWVALDHKLPVVPVTGWDSWDGYIDRMFNGEMQLLCIACHKIKSTQENEERRQGNGKIKQKLNRQSVKCKKTSPSTKTYSKRRGST